MQHNVLLNIPLFDDIMLNLFDWRVGVVSVPVDRASAPHWKGLAFQHHGSHYVYPPNSLKLIPDIGGLKGSHKWLSPDTSNARHWSANSQKYPFSHIQLR